jgi:hypothetical protein
MRALVVASVATAALCWAAGVNADLNECLGLEMATLLTVPSCMELFSACQVGVSKLNQKLDVAVEDLKPVSVISASDSKTVGKNSTKLAMLVQLAPLINCLSTSATATEDRCVNAARRLSRIAANGVTAYMAVAHLTCPRWNFTASS